jgi:PAS domain-containing protein
VAVDGEVVRVAQEPIEMILLRQWASYIAVPIWIADAEGNLVYYNEPAETLLGRRFDEAGEVNAGVLSDLFVTTDIDGQPIPSDELPLVRALVHREPAHRQLRITTTTGAAHVIEVTAVPIEGQGGRHLGAFATFWVKRPG